MSRPNLYPTHVCFDDSLDTIGAMLRLCPEIELDLRLVHALCTAPGGRIYAHAWVEDDRRNVCMFDGILNGERVHCVAPLNEYRLEHKIQVIVRYSVREALRLNHQHGHYGPWIENFRMFCGGRTVYLPEESV